MTRLAIHGGTPEVPQPVDQWPRISPREATRVIALLNAGIVHQKSTTLQVEFEREFAAAVGERFCVSFASGTAAVEAAFAAVGVGKGSRVVMQSYAYPAGAIAARALGADPIFVDCKDGCLQIDEAEVRKHLSEAPAAVFVQHCWGNVGDLEALRADALAHSVPIVADCSHSFGATWDGSRPKLHGDIGVYSLGPGKWVSGGELGAIVCSSSAFHDRCIMYSGMNRPRSDLIHANEWKDLESCYSVKSRPHVYALALAMGSLERAEEKIRRSTAIGTLMASALKDCGWFLPEDVRPNVQRVFWRLVAELKEEWDLGAVVSAMKAEGIHVEPNEYAPLLHLRRVHRWQSFSGLLRDRDKYPRTDNAVALPVAESLGRRLVTFGVPIKPSVDYAAAIRRVLGKMAAHSTEFRRIS